MNGAGTQMKDCNEGRHWFWKLIFDAHAWEQLYWRATLYGDSEVGERCYNCGKIRTRQIPGGP